MTYAELLNSEEWKTKRQNIILRDSKKCQQCDNSKYLSPLNSGLIIGNDSVGQCIAFTKIRTKKDFYIIRIWDFKNEDNLESMMNKNTNFDINQNQIAYFIKNGKYSLGH